MQSCVNNVGTGVCLLTVAATLNVNLNARLLFLSSGLVRHVLLHELCHLREMNHSRAFYECLRNVDPEVATPMPK